MVGDAEEEDLLRINNKNIKQEQYDLLGIEADQISKLFFGKHGQIF